MIDSAELSIHAGAAVLERILAMPPDDRPTAVFCANDLLAIGVVNACVRRGVAVPDELSVVGYDDISFAETASVALTTVAQPGRRLGSEAARLLFEAERLPRNATFTPSLRVRASAAARIGSSTVG